MPTTKPLCKICNEYPAFEDGVCRWESCEAAANITPEKISGVPNDLGCEMPGCDKDAYIYGCNELPLGYVEACKDHAKELLARAVADRNVS